MNPPASTLQTTGGAQRIESFDSIRGLAAFVVLLEHSTGLLAWPEGMLSWQRWPLINSLFDGRSAVTMFFVLSGYVLSLPYLIPRASGGDARRLYLPTFYLRRVTRIWIPWAATFALSAAAQAFARRSWPVEPPVSPWLEQFWQIPLTWHSVLRQCIFWQHDIRYLLLPQDWSLGVELKGSALLPLFVFLVRRRAILLVALLVGFLLGWSTGAYYVSFGLGVLTARYHPALLARLQAWPSGWRWSFFAVGCVLYQARYEASFFWEVKDTADKVVWCFTSVGCVMIMMGCLTIRQLQDILTHRWPAALGRISYSVYLLQFVVLMVLAPACVFALNLMGLRQNLVLFPLSMLISVSLTILLSLPNYRFVEIPSIALGHWLTVRIQQYRTRRPEL